MLASAQGTKLSLDHVPVIVAHERPRGYPIKSTMLAYEHNSVAIGVEVVLALPGLAPWHE